LAAAAAAAAAAEGLAGEGGATPLVSSTGAYGSEDGPVEQGRLIMAGGDLQRVRPPRRLVVVVRAAAPAELFECTDEVEGGRLGVEFVMMGAGCEAILRFETEFAGDVTGGGALPSSSFTGAARSFGTVSGDFFLLFSSSLDAGLVSAGMVLTSSPQAYKQNRTGIEYNRF
jgi:hypothetical protein